jgi:osmotically-inducible protein OsmY
MSDHELREAVEQALEWEPIIDAKSIGVATKDGIVTLTGHVPSYAEKRETEKVAGLVRGVRAVACELEVALPFFSERSDEEIARAAADAIAWNTLLTKGSIQVWVDHGRVTLEGTVDWQYQRKAAADCVRYLEGVRDVNNHIGVTPVANQMVVKTKIQAALLRNAQLDANRIRVEVHGPRVSLSGTVQSWVEREAAERAAWAAPGVSEVDNLLIVNPVSNLLAC